MKDWHTLFIRIIKGSYSDRGLLAMLRRAYGWNRAYMVHPRYVNISHINRALFDICREYELLNFDQFFDQLTREDGVDFLTNEPIPVNKKIFDTLVHAIRFCRPSEVMPAYTPQARVRKRA